MDPFSKIYYYDNQYYPCSIKDCVSEVFAFVLYKYDSKVKNTILYIGYLVELVWAKLRRELMQLFVGQKVIYIKYAPKHYDTIFLTI